MSRWINIKLTDKYILSQVLFISALILIIFLSIYLIFDFFEKIDNFWEAKVPSGTIITYFLFYLPSIIIQILPATCLLGTLIALGLLKKNNEFIVLKACGFSPYRITAPIIILGIIISVALFFFNETILPKTISRAQSIWRYKVEKKRPRGGYMQEKIWLKGEDMIYQIEGIDFKRNIMWGVNIYYFDKNFKIKRKLNAYKACWGNGKWVLYHGIEQIPDKHGALKINQFTSKTIYLPETPNDFQFIKQDYERLNYFELRHYVNKLKSKGYNAVSFEVEMWQKTAIPWAPLLMIILAIPFGLKVGKTMKMIGLGLLIALIFWVMQALTLALGKSGHLHSFLAAWIPNLLFGVWGIIMLRYVEE